MNKVYIVGAGCGDINLYTLKAIRLIKEADCIIYDDLIDAPVLDYCKENAVKKYVGKRMHKHSFKQQEINQLLIESAGKYEIVVRLKGGDPYVFGRGGEEALALADVNIPFEVVPGISSCVGGLAYAGIPVTHRGMSRGFQVYTGHFEDDTLKSIQFHTMLSDDYTYIFLMSISKLEMIVKGFLEAGKRKDTPLAIVSHASLANQCVLISTLENILEDYKNQPLPTPGMIVVGNVVSLSSALNFTLHKPLRNKKILLALTENDPSMSSTLEFYGADVTSIHTGKIQYVPFEIPEEKGFFIFTSSHGVHGFFKEYLKQHDVRTLSQVKFIVVGQKTKETLNQYGIVADYLPSIYNGETLNNEFKTLVADKPVTLFKGNHDSSVTIASKEIQVYVNASSNIPQYEAAFDYGLFTSPSSFKRFYEVNGDLCKKYISIGKHTTQIIKEKTDKEIIEAARSTKEAMIEALIKDTNDNSRD